MLHVFITDGILSQFNCNKFWLLEIVISTPCSMSRFCCNNRAANFCEQAEKFPVLELLRSLFTTADLTKLPWKRVRKPKGRENAGSQGGKQRSHPPLGNIIYQGQWYSPLTYMQKHWEWALRVEKPGKWQITLALEKRENVRSRNPAPKKAKTKL